MDSSGMAMCEVDPAVTGLCEVGPAVTGPCEVDPAVTGLCDHAVGPAVTLTDWREARAADQIVKYRLRRCGRERQPTRFSISPRLFSLSLALSRAAPPLGHAPHHHLPPKPHKERTTPHTTPPSTYLQ